MCYPVSPLVKRSYAADHQFALCEFCLSATILRSGERNVHITSSCPICSSDNISVIPLTSYDVYELDVGSKAGLQIEFSRANKI
ncbi:MAG: hypothetical protein DLM72_02200 [Candidatus Nitrosopolaris wilkensis]|nr:MAG: hypothetical protein DLM72_02200 [Candidatus Nitrosopolaris wilkensis]